MRLRNILTAVEEIKKKDPETAITYYMLNRMVLRGEVPSKKYGGRHLVDLDTLDKYLSPTEGDV